MKILLLSSRMEEEEIDLTLDFGDDGEIVVAAGGDDFASDFGA